MAKFEVGDKVTVDARVLRVYDDEGMLHLEIGGHSIGCDFAVIATHTPMTLEQRLAGLTIEQITDALSRKDSVLADAIEAAGAKIAKARRDSGELRRTRAPKETVASPVAAEAAGEAHAAQPAVDTPAAEPDGLEVSAYMLAELAAKQGQKAFAQYLAALDDDGREECREFMPELLGIAANADAAKHEVDMPF